MNRTGQKRKHGDRRSEVGGQRPKIGDGEGFYTKPEMACLLKVSIRTVTKMMRGGLLPYLRYKGIVRFRLEDVNRRLTETCLFCDGTEATGGTKDNHNNQQIPRSEETRLPRKEK